jgi:hypothetical protein
MRLRLILGLVVLGALALASSAPAQVYARPLDTFGANCFLYHDYAYLPLRSVTGFVGAGLTVGGGEGVSMTVSLANETLGLTPGSTRAYFNGSPVELPVPPFEVNGVMMVPVTLFHDYFFIDVDWQPSLNRVFVYGPEGWGYCDVSPEPSPYASRVIRSYGGPFYNPSPFFYAGVPFAPLLGWSSFFGFPVFFEPDFDDFTIVVAGRNFLLSVGSPFVFFGRERFLLPASPIIVANRVFVPLSFFSLPVINAPVEVVGNVVRLRGLTGMRQVRIAPRPPARIVTTLPAQPRQLGIPMRPAVIPGLVTPTPRPPAQAMRPPRAAPPVTAVRPTPPRVAARPTPPAPAVRPTPPAVAVRPTPEARAVRPPVAPPTAPMARPTPPSVAQRPPMAQGRPTVPALRPGVSPQTMRQGSRLALAPPRSPLGVQPRPAPPIGPQAVRPAPVGPPRTEQRPGPPTSVGRGQGQARSRG